MSEELMITKEDLVNWLNRPPSNDDLDLIGFITTRLENFYKLEQENKQLKELKYKFFDNCCEEESFTLEDYLEIGNKLYDYEQENKQLKEQLENKIDLYEDSISYQLGFDKGKEYLQQNTIYRLTKDKENE